MAPNVRGSSSSGGGGGAPSRLLYENDDLEKVYNFEKQGTYQHQAKLSTACDETVLNCVRFAHQSKQATIQILHQLK